MTRSSSLALQNRGVASREGGSAKRCHTPSADLRRRGGTTIATGDIGGTKTVLVLFEEPYDGRQRVPDADPMRVSIPVIGSDFSTNFGRGGRAMLP